MLSNIFFQPTPSSFDLKANIKVSVTVAICVYLTLYGLQPFGMDTLPKNDKLQMCLSFGLITFIITSVVIVFFSKLLPNFTDERNWKVWKEILFVLLLVLVISLGNTVYIINYYRQEFSFGIFKLMTYYTLLVATLPVVVSILLKQQILLKKYTIEAASLDQNIRVNNTSLTKGSEPNINHNHHEKKITLIGDNQNETLILDQNNLQYIQAEDNYVKICYKTNGVAEQVFFRATLLKMEGQIKHFDQFYRCHKSFIVNMSQVAHVKGNSQGLKLSFDLIADEVPVSRSLSAEIRKKLS